MPQIIVLEHGISIGGINFPNNSLAFGIKSSSIIQISLAAEGKIIFSRDYTEFTDEDDNVYVSAQAVIDDLLLNNAGGGGDGTWGSITGTLSDQTDLQQELTTLQENIDSEAVARSDADDTLQDNIDTEETARTNADSTLQTNITNEATARGNADTTLQNNITSEAATRAAADTALSNRTSTLENNVLKTLYYASISATSGQIAKPTGSTIILSDFPEGIDAIVETIINGEPSGVEPVTAGGAYITVTSFDADGNYILSGTPTGYPVAIVYVLSIAEINKGNLTFDNIIGTPSVVNQATKGYVDAKITQVITNGVLDKAPSEDAVFDALALKLIKASNLSDLPSPSTAVTNLGLSSAAGLNDGSFGVTYSGQGGVIGTNNYAQVTIPYAGTITGWIINSINPADGTALSGSIVIDIKRSGSSIIGAGNKPTLTGASSASAAASAWTSVAVAANDVLIFYVVSATTVVQVEVIITMTKT